MDIFTKCPPTLPRHTVWMRFSLLEPWLWSRFKNKPHWAKVFTKIILNMARQNNPPANTGFEIVWSGRSFLLQWKVQTEKKNYENSVHECQKPGCFLKWHSVHSKYLGQQFVPKGLENCFSVKSGSFHYTICLDLCNVGKIILTRAKKGPKCFERKNWRYYRSWDFYGIYFSKYRVFSDQHVSQYNTIGILR